MFKQILAPMFAAALMAACQTVGEPVQSLTVSHGINEKGWIAFHSSNPYDFADYGTSNATSTVITGKLDFPENAQPGQTYPVLITVHGSGGVYGRSHNWARRARERGYASFIMDSFSGRSVGETTGDQTQITESMMTADLFAAARLLTTHPMIDAKRIAAIGFSKGGAVVLLAASKNMQDMFGGQNLIGAVISNYGGCLYHPVEKTLSAPALLLNGDKDETTPVGPCIKYVEEYKAAGNDVTLKIYEGGFHGFDRTNGPWKTSKSMSLGNCSFDISANGHTSFKGQPMGTVEGRKKALQMCAGAPGTGGWHGRNKDITNDAYATAFEFLNSKLN